jgi:hypothetical protein
VIDSRESVMDQIAMWRDKKDQDEEQKEAKSGAKNKV